MFNIENICNPDYLSVFEKYVENQENLELLKANSNQEHLSNEDFHDVLLTYFKDNDQKIFHILSDNIINNCKDDFEVILTYNTGFLDWKESQGDNFDDDSWFEYYSNSYAYLDDVSVFLFRTSDYLCFYHNGYESDNDIFNVIHIENLNFRNQIVAEISRINIEFNGE